MPHLPDSAAILSPAVTHSHVSAETPFGWIGVQRREHLVARLFFDLPSQQRMLEAFVSAIAQDRLDAAEVEFQPSEDDVLIGRLQAYFHREADDFLDVELHDRGLTPFTLRVIDACRSIPIGQTMSYAELAAVAGSPGAARAVGNIMAGNRVPIIVPCHRVVGSGGSLGGYSSSGGLRTKRRLLSLEASLK